MIQVNKSLRIDEDGYLQSGELRLVDVSFGNFVLSRLQRRNNGSFFYIDDESNEIDIEAYDEPIVIQTVEYTNGELWGQAPYEFKFQIHSLCVDEWDRFHTLSPHKIPAVFSRKGQAQLFDLASDFDDDSITIENRTYNVPPFYSELTTTNDSKYWDDRYSKQDTLWDLGEPHPAFVSTLPQLKLMRSRVLIVGCGAGHDAAFFARQGHIVTAIDFSQEAITKAKETYGQSTELKFECVDFFTYAENHAQQFDVVIEHTLFPAIPPQMRSKYISSVKKVLSEGGTLLGVFFVTSSRSGPPFGSSEWEIQKQFSKGFQMLYWQRIKNSPESRHGKELLVYMRKNSNG